MWVNYELQNTCDTSNVDVCYDNANCRLDSNLKVGSNQREIVSYMRDTYKGGRNTSKYKDFWDDKNWNEYNMLTSDVCSWDGITCHEDRENNKYITSVSIDDKYFNNPNQHNDVCQYNNSR